jgi:hypothetical protein
MTRLRASTDTEGRLTGRGVRYLIFNRRGLFAGWKVRPVGTLVNDLV